MPKTCTRLTEAKRYQIYEGVAEKRSPREITSLINTHHSVASSTRGPIIGRVGKEPLIAHIPGKQAKVVKDAISKLLESEKAHFQSLGFDRGKAFAYHAQIKEAPGVCRAQPFVAVKKC